MPIEPLSRRAADETMSARRIEPLQIVDRDQHRRLLGEPFQHGQEACCYGTLIGYRAIGAHPQENPLDRKSLRRRQARESGLAQPLQQADQRPIGQHRFRRRDARRQHAKPHLARPLHFRQPHGGLADAGLTLNHQPEGPDRAEARKSSTAHDSAPRLTTGAGLNEQRQPNDRTSVILANSGNDHERAVRMELLQHRSNSATLA
jgi:hypothetical protein